MRGPSPTAVEVADLMARKGEQRRKAYDLRQGQPDKDERSRAAIAKLLALPEYDRARTAMWYLDCRSELRTRWALPAALAGDKRIVVPFCTLDEQGQNKLGLWWLRSMDELVVGKWKILEPPRERWEDPERVVAPEELDIVMVPGVAFSRVGGRMGNGQGYYDRLLAQVRPDCALVAVCYESQLMDDLIVAPHDAVMHRVVTEDGIYQGRSRS
jgi:5-formyltetrahydrofolate cyclo-ligase